MIQPDNFARLQRLEYGLVEAGIEPCRFCSTEDNKIEGFPKVIQQFLEKRFPHYEFNSALSWGLASTQISKQVERRVMRRDFGSK